MLGTVTGAGDVEAHPSVLVLKELPFYWALYVGSPVSAWDQGLWWQLFLLFFSNMQHGTQLEAHRMPSKKAVFDGLLCSRLIVCIQWFTSHGLIWLIYIRIFIFVLQRSQLNYGDIMKRDQVPEASKVMMLHSNPWRASFHSPQIVFIWKFLLTPLSNWVWSQRSWPLDFGGTFPDCRVLERPYVLSWKLDIWDRAS